MIYIANLDYTHVKEGIPVLHYFINNTTNRFLGYKGLNSWEGSLSHWMGELNNSHKRYL